MTNTITKEPDMTNQYGLRDPKTGLIARISRQLSGCSLSFEPSKPFWMTTSLAGLITTYCEIEPEAPSSSAPRWSAEISPKLCTPIRFLTECDHDIAGGDPIARREFLQSFDLGSVYDLRNSLYRGGDLTNIHYGRMQQLFTNYDMDKIEHQSLAIVSKSGAHPNLRGDIGITHDIGPARIMGVADVPEDWVFSSEQTEHFKELAAKGWTQMLVLLDSHELENWLDFDSIDPDTSLSKRSAPESIAHHV